ncbi:hypothetical protein BEWA_019810 [Theileria equi strain WA]|uniref:5'-3' DNA helicase ZGRF1-like N-terminal domain-containing protein n=1 Tax=Theileria equi strain WA TaxID=1537102 RepID=L0AUA2_THEEQ|nr:hypothetical protein BEWA_019810 [Theileria equi strain WA]AFZ79135.1 hypothetical protein BEWA_019810 [Theileria equi strain WA]|eukprot:XP_004828801.1 hypothetical protein BEWA_019810 [Theileria equi strain WA]
MGTMSVTTYYCYYTTNVTAKRKKWHDGIAVAKATHGFVRLALYEYDAIEDKRGKSIDNLDIFNETHNSLSRKEFTTPWHIIEVANISGSNSMDQKKIGRSTPLSICSGFMKKQTDTTYRQNPPYNHYISNYSQPSPISSIDELKEIHDISNAENIDVRDIVRKINVMLDGI